MATDQEKQQQIEALKGDEITFIEGTKIGKTGWLSTKLNKEAGWVNVIYSKGDGVLKHVRTKEIFVMLTRQIPTSYEEAALMQNPDLKVGMDRLCDGLAEAKITPSKDMELLFAGSLLRANANQIKKGHKARWREVTYREDDDIEM